MQGLEKTLFIMPKQAEYDEEVAKYFLLTEEIVLSVKTLGVFDKDPQAGLVFVEGFIT